MRRDAGKVVETNRENCHGSEVRDEQGQSGQFRVHLKAANGEIGAAA